MAYVRAWSRSANKQAKMASLSESENNGESSRNGSGSGISGGSSVIKRLAISWRHGGSMAANNGVARHGKKQRQQRHGEASIGVENGVKAKWRNGAIKCGGVAS